MADIRISELPQAGTLTGTELVPVVQNGQTVQTTVSDINVTPVLTQTYLTFSLEASLANSRYLSAGTGIGLVNNGVQNPYQIYLNGTSGSLELASTGIIVKSGVNTITSRSIAVSGSGLTISNGDGVSGNPTVALSGLPASLASLSGNGIVCLNSSTTLVARTLTGTANQIDIANGTGTANPVISISNNPVLSGLAGVTLPQGGTAQRAGSAGTIRYNTDTLVFEGYANGSWSEFAVAGGVTSFSAGSTGLTPSSSTTGAITLAGTLNVASGGTGANTLTGYVYGNGTSVMTASTTIPTTDLSGTISNAQLANSAITINGSSVSLGGSVTVTATASNPLTIGTGLSGTSYNGSSAVTIAIANTGVTATTYGSASAVPVIAVNAQGQITSATNTNISIASSAITDKGLANGVASLDSSGKVPTSQIPLQGDLNYQGTWNATTNTPTLTSSVGTQGYYYVVDVAGTTNLNGITDWQVGDWAIFNGSVWQKVDNTDAVTSVNGQVGTVVLTTTNIAEGTNEYFTQTRARQSISAGTGISYDNSTGVVTNSAPDQTVVLNAGTGISTSGTYPNFTITNTSPSLGGDVVGPSSATDNAIARFDTTTGKLIQNSVVTVSDTGVIAGATSISNINYVDFDTTYATTLTEGQLGWDGNNTLGLGMAGGNVIQHIGEDQFFYFKATSAVTKGQVVMFTGAVGASGVPTGAPATGITDGTYIMGIAAESVSTNGFGLVQSFGTLRNVDTSAYSDGDILWYNPAVTGGLTATKPSAPNVKVQMCAVINGGSVGGGTILIRINAGSVLGGTDSNVQFGTLNTNDLIQYNGTYWANVAPSTVTVGTATNATNVAVTADSTNASRYLAFYSATTGNLGTLVDSDLTYNPSTNTLTVGTLVATVGISGGTF